MNSTTRSTWEAFRSHYPCWISSYPR